MERRLLPVNAVLGLCEASGFDDPLLARGGFRVAALEVPVGLGDARVVVDLVLQHATTNLLIACEGKSGANIEPRQAKRYARLDPVALVQAASVDLRADVTPSVAALYVCLQEHVDRISQGLIAAGVRLPVLGVEARGVELHAREAAPAQLAGALAGGLIGRPYGHPRIVPCDAESSVEVVKPQVEAVLVSQLSKQVPLASAQRLAEDTLTSLPIYGQAARQRFVKLVEQCLRVIAQEHPETYEFQGRTGSRDAQVRFLRSPEDNHLQGRTQSYQALARTRDTHRGRPRPVDPNQLDLLGQLGTPDDDENGWE